MTKADLDDYLAKLHSHTWQWGETRRSGPYGFARRETDATCACGARALDYTQQSHHSAFVNSFGFVDPSGAQMCPLKPIPEKTTDIQASYDADA